MAPAQNHLIERLPRRDRLSLLAAGSTVDLVLGQVLDRAGAQTRHAYFPVDGFVSLVAADAGEPALEVGMVGREGMLGAQLVLGVAQSPLHALVQGPGAAWRIGRVAFRAELAQSAPLRGLLHRYLHVLMGQLADAAVCNRYHEIGPRLARWLLMTQDRAHDDRFQATHEFLAYMLGVRRVGVTAAAGAMQKAGLIEYHRGHVHVLDRGALRAAACPCYGLGCDTYARHIG